LILSYKTILVNEGRVLVSLLILPAVMGQLSRLQETMAVIIPIVAKIVYISTLYFFIS